jgi:hypothetical protein
MTSTDPLITLRNLIIDNWTVTDADLSTIGDSSKKVFCTTGTYDQNQPLQPQIAVAPVSCAVTENYISHNAVHSRELYDIHIYTPILRESGKGVGVAKKWLWILREEVKRIVNAKVDGVSGATLLLTSGMFVPEQDADPVALHFVYTVSVEFFEAT